MDSGQRETGLGRATKIKNNIGKGKFSSLKLLKRVGKLEPRDSKNIMKAPVMMLLNGLS